ncbi:MAG: DUF86 domain-containing protein [Candidatus Marsarchaeota archaeon]|nr:DUF86 domain-containing protein [Candidatus Marsarchaeota archaeon]
MSEHHDIFYLKHILDAITNVEESLKKLSKKHFLKNKDVRDANVRRLEVIGEAVKNISNKLKHNHKEVEWKRIAATRDKIIHHYFGIDFEIVWNIIKKDLPKLKKQVKKIKSELKTD